MQVCKTRKVGNKIETYDCRDEPSRARPATTATAGTKTGSAPGLKYNERIFQSQATGKPLYMSTEGKVQAVSMGAVPPIGPAVKSLAKSVGPALAYLGLDYLADKISTPKEAQQPMAVSNRYDDPGTPAVEIAAPGLGAALQRLIPGGGSGLTTAAGLHGYVVKQWSTGTAQFAMYQDGTIATITKSGMLKTWKPYHPIVFGKKSDARKLARLIKRHHKDWKELNKVFGKSRRTSCRKK